MQSGPQGLVCKVGDFGLATRSRRRIGTGIATCLLPSACASAAAGSVACMTTAVGTPIYTAPEVASPEYDNKVQDEGE